MRQVELAHAQHQRREEQRDDQHEQQPKEDLPDRNRGVFGEDSHPARVVGERVGRQAQARARVRLAIEDVLDQGLPEAYTADLYQQKCTAVFEHVYETQAAG